MNRLAAFLVMLGVAVAGCAGDPADEESSAADQSPSPSDPAASASPTAGAHQLSVLAQPGMAATDAVVEVPDGFEDGDEWYVVSSDGDAFLGLWTAGQVQRDACHGPPHFVTPGPSVEDLADLLVAQKSSRATTPEPVRLAEHDGLYLQLTGPGDLGACEEPGISDSRGIYGDHQVDMLWILDVDGQRLVVDASYGDTATRSEIDAVAAMAKSLTFVPPAPA